MDRRVETAREVSNIVDARDELGFTSAVLVTVPVPERYALDNSEIERILAESLRSAAEHGIVGKGVTPFLLSDMSSRSDGRTLEANIALLENNARVAAEIAKSLS